MRNIDLPESYEGLACEGCRREFLREVPARFAGVEGPLCEHHFMAELRIEAAMADHGHGEGEG
jgi:hypothetical protein